jgi:hypothetical protein
VTYVYRANEVLGTSHDVGEQHREQDSHDPCSNKTLDSLLRGKLDKLGAAERDTADIREDIVGNNQRSRQEEPNHTLKDVVHDEVSLADDEVQGHVRPGKVGELKLVVAGLEGSNKEDEA